MAEQITKCVLCSQLLAVVADISGNPNIENSRNDTDKKLDNDTVIICPKCWALTPIDDEFLKKLPLDL